ncbi:ABATE domain-containing protein [uncultured Caulobacter sp.]|uniref:CGNR zinc finger domain-containing protein n=1 Tax=uncultured Caulobacter sp. TaxID=158749 RepID=UPI00260D15E5|nr:ABATE domain-containing protein [uncultured Caulobacter sp.]
MTSRSEETRDGFRFRGGRLPLDLTATLAGRISGAHRESLNAPADLDRWLVAAGLTDRAAGSTADDLLAARALREALYALATARAEGRALPDAGREALNAFAAQPAAAPWLDPAGDRRLHGGVRALLASVAREAIELLGGPDGQRVRQCQGPTCAILFLDTSRAGDRRWCSMSACGNRAKVAAFRQRER